MGFDLQGEGKKLRAAARFWAGERPAATSLVSSLTQQLEDLGAPLEVIEASRVKPVVEEVSFLVWEENWRAVSVFLAMGTQWRTSVGMAGVVFHGLDYQALESVLRLEGIPPEDWSGLFDALRVMERAALPLLNEKD